MCEHHCDVAIGYMHCMTGLHRITDIALLQFTVCNCCQVDAMSVVRQRMNSCCHALTVRNLHQQDALASQADWDWSEASA